MLVIPSRKTYARPIVGNLNKEALYNNGEAGARKIFSTHIQGTSFAEISHRKAHEWQQAAQGYDC
jgi:hypothetical protein